MVEKNESVNPVKSKLWMYFAFVLIALVIVLALLMFKNNGIPTGNVINENDASDFSFIENSNLYPFIGPVDAEVKVIVFYDFQCPFCALTTGLPVFTEQYESKYGEIIGSEKKLETLAEDGKIKLVYATMSFLGPESDTAAEAFLCANEQGRFLEMHDAIFTAHDGKENNGKYSSENLKAVAEKIEGLNMEKFAECLDRGKYNSAVKEMTTNANNAGIQGTPAFVINGVTSSPSWKEISSKLQSLDVQIYSERPK